MLAGALGLPIIAYLAIAVFGVQTLFIDNTVDEGGPVFASQATVEPELDSDSAPASSTVAPAPDQQDSTTTTAAGAEITILFEGSFIDRAHPSSGIASVLGDGSD